MSLTKDLEVVRRYLILESEELSELKKDILALEQLLCQTLVSEKAVKLAHYYQKEITKEEFLIARIERRLDRMLTTIERIMVDTRQKIPAEDQKALRRIQENVRVCKQKLIRILARNGELHQLIQKQEWPLTERKIEEALGSAEDPGIHSLLVLIQDLEHTALPQQEEIKIKGITIPPGYSPIQDIEDVGKYDPEQVRWFDNIPFLFDPLNPIYLALIERCQEDTRKLAVYLHREIKRKNLPVWVKRSRLPSSKSKYRKMSFLIRTPYFASNATKDEETRLQNSLERDVFILHFDQYHQLQTVRFWSSAGSEKGYWILILRHVIAEGIENTKAYWCEHYGQWREFSKGIAEILEKSKQGLDKILP